MAISKLYSQPIHLQLLKLFFQAMKTTTYSCQSIKSKQLELLINQQKVFVLLHWSFQTILSNYEK